MTDPTRAGNDTSQRWWRRPAVGCLVAVSLAYVGLSVFLIVGRERAGSMGLACAKNERTLATALQLYVSDWGEFPVAHRWCDELSAYIAKSPNSGRDGAFRCPAAANRECSYALSSALSGTKATATAGQSDDHEPRAVAVFESDAGWNAAGGSELLPNKPRHVGGDRYAFVDGSTAWVPRRKLPDGTWAKEPKEGYQVTWKP